jgi:hypothetical protein
MEYHILVDFLITFLEHHNMIAKTSFNKSYNKSASPFGLIDKFICFNAVPINRENNFFNNLNTKNLEELEKSQFITTEQKKALEKHIKIKPTRLPKVGQRIFMESAYRGLTLVGNLTSSPVFCDISCIANQLGFDPFNPTVSFDRATRIAQAFESKFNTTGGSAFLNKKIHSRIYAYKTYKLKDTRGERTVRIIRAPELDKDNQLKYQSFINFLPEEKYYVSRGSAEHDFSPSMAHFIAGSMYNSVFGSASESAPNDGKKKYKKYSENLKDFANNKYEILGKITKNFKKPIKLEDSKKAELAMIENLSCGEIKGVNLSIRLNHGEHTISRNIKSMVKYPNQSKDSQLERSIFGKHVKHKSGTCGYNVPAYLAVGPYSSTVQQNLVGNVYFGSLGSLNIYATLPTESYFSCCYGLTFYNVLNENESSAGFNCEEVKDKETYIVDPIVPSYTNKWNIRTK